MAADVGARARRCRPGLLALLALGLTALAAVPARAQAGGPGAPGAASVPPTVDLNQRLAKLAIEETPAGVVVTVATSQGERTLGAGEYLQLVRAAQVEQRSHRFYAFFNITRRSSLAWIALGFLGQAMFTFRMVLQWLASEKEKRSVVPVGFWWGSLLGGMMLLAYFVWRKDVVGVVGQSTGVVIYARNLFLIYRPRAPVAAAPSASLPRPP